MPIDRGVVGDPPRDRAARCRSSPAAVDSVADRIIAAADRVLTISSDRTLDRPVITVHPQVVAAPSVGVLATRVGAVDPLAPRPPRPEHGPITHRTVPPIDPGPADAPRHVGRAQRFHVARPLQLDLDSLVAAGSQSHDRDSSRSVSQPGSVECGRFLPSVGDRADSPGAAVANRLTRAQTSPPPWRIVSPPGRGRSVDVAIAPNGPVRRFGMPGVLRTRE